MKIFIESGSPSKLRLRKTSKTLNKTYRNPALDVYDMKDYGSSDKVNRKVSVTNITGEGFIQDKQGNTYPVSVSSRFDAYGSGGMGTTYYYVVINYNNNKIELSSYSGAASKSSGYSIVKDLEDGVFLEDYLQKYKYDVDTGKDTVSEIILSNKEFKNTTYKQDKKAKYL